jgi:hypothetical protein
MIDLFIIVKHLMKNKLGIQIQCSAVATYHHMIGSRRTLHDLIQKVVSQGLWNETIHHSSNDLIVDDDKNLFKNNEGNQISSCIMTFIITCGTAKFWGAYSYAICSLNKCYKDTTRSRNIHEAYSSALLQWKGED